MTREEQTLQMWEAERDVLKDWVNTTDYGTPYEVKTIIESRINELTDWINKRIHSMGR